MFLQRKGEKFQWTEKCVASFQRLKELLTRAPFSKIVDLGKYFVVFTDACTEGLGGILMQYDNVICYEPRNIKEHERNYMMHDLELASIVHSLRLWRHYFLGRRFELRTNHMSLKYLFEQPSLNASQA